MGVEVQDRFCRGCGAPLGAAASGHELRKTVTVVFCDVTGSTALGERLDPEALRHVLGRYYSEMRLVLERHGGLVEKFIGDAVVAVFGVPLVHEDDALRAVRAAAEMRESLERLNDGLEQESGVRIGVRIGVNTGEVVAGDLGPGASFASGDAVNVAARLEQAAGSGEILIGPLTHQLLAGAIEAEPLEPLDLHGKSEPVEAFRLAAVAADAKPISRHPETVFVGRDSELALLREAFDEAVAGPSCRLVTVVGEPGIGKTRLLSEFALSVDDQARVLTGHCLPYGEGITYWPLAEIVRGLAPDDPGAMLAGYLASDERGDLASDLVLGAVGASDSLGSVEETQWAVRRLFEALTRERPLVVVFEDLHWAEPTFLQLVEYLAGFSTGSPILLLAAARDELLEQQPSWALPRPNAQLLPLGALSEAEGELLVGGLTGGDRVSEAMRTRITRTGAGNPLFLEQLLAMQAEEGETDQELPLPATIKALLAARLDRLTVPERDLLERAAVEGVSFHRRPVTALLPDSGQAEVGPSLLSAIRRNLIRSGRSEFPGDDGYQFAHVLVRDAVYQSMPKELRAQLHEQFAAWLEQALGARSSEFEEILGYHLEQTARYKRELGRPDSQLAERASDRLAAAGRRTLWRADYRSAAPLLERALELARPTRLDVHLEVDLADALALGVGDTLRAVEIADAAAARAHAAGNDPGEALARVVASNYRFTAGAESTDELESQARAALPLLERAGDHAGLEHIWWALGFMVANMRGRFGDAADALEEALHQIRLSRRPRTVYGWGVAAMLILGPRPVGEALRRVDELLAEAPSPVLLADRAELLAMLGHFDEASQIAIDACAQAHEFGTVSGEETMATLARLAGDHETAARHLRRKCDELEEHDNRAQLSSFAPLLGRELCALGQYDEAARLARQGRELGTPDDSITQMLWRQVQALVHAYRSDHAEAERLAREAVEIGERTDALNCQGDALCDLAEVLEAAGRPSRQPTRSSRRSTATSASRTSPWSPRCVRGSNSCERAYRTERRRVVATISGLRTAPERAPSTGAPSPGSRPRWSGSGRVPATAASLSGRP